MQIQGRMFQIIRKFPEDQLNWEKIDLLFLSLPNGEAQKVINKLYYKYENLKFIDLSADFRIENENVNTRFRISEFEIKMLILDSGFQT